MRMNIKYVGWEVVEWIHVLQVTDQWGALVNTVMNLGFHKKREISCSGGRLLASQEELCSVELVKKVKLSLCLFLTEHHA
jgi:hypothetical protein